MDPVRADTLRTKPNRTRRTQRTLSGLVEFDDHHTSFTMSLLRQSLARPVVSRSLVSARFLGTETKTPATTDQPTANIVPDTPARGIVAAEIVSGAPGS